MNRQSNNRNFLIYKLQFTESSFVQYKHKQIQKHHMLPKRYKHETSCIEALCIILGSFIPFRHYLLLQNIILIWFRPNIDLKANLAASAAFFFKKNNGTKNLRRKVFISYTLKLLFLNDK